MSFTRTTKTVRRAVCKAMERRNPDGTFKLPPRMLRWMRWGMEARLFGPARGHVLFVGFTTSIGGYNVLALQGPAHDGTKTPIDFLQNHAHAIVAENIRTKREAKKLAEAFGKKWMKKPDLDDCGCKNIGGAS